MTEQYERISYYQRRASAEPGSAHTTLKAKGGGDTRKHPSQRASGAKTLSRECSLPPVTDAPPTDYEQTPVVDLFVSLSHSQSERVAAIANLVNRDLFKGLHGRQAPILDADCAFFRNYEALPPEKRARLQALARQLLAGSAD